MIKYMIEAGKGEGYIENFKEDIERERTGFKKRSISWLITNTPETFQDVIGFDDWNSGMLYLVSHQEEAFKFWRLKND